MTHFIVFFRRLALILGVARINVTIDSAFIEALNASVEAASYGGFFSGSTPSGIEGCWIGYRGSTTYGFRWNCLILLGHNEATFKIVWGIRLNQSWSFYLLKG